MMNLSPQAITLAIVYVVVIIVSLSSSIWYKMFSPMTLVNLFISIMFFILILYDTNCLTKGECYVWSWIRTILYGAISIISIVLTIWFMDVYTKIAKTAQESQITLTPMY